MNAFSTTTNDFCEIRTLELLVLFVNINAEPSVLTLTYGLGGLMVMFGLFYAAG